MEYNIINIQPLRLRKYCEKSSPLGDKLLVCACIVDKQMLFINKNSCLYAFDFAITVVLCVCVCLTQREREREREIA